MRATATCLSILLLQHIPLLSERNPFNFGNTGPGDRLASVRIDQRDSELVLYVSKKGIVKRKIKPVAYINFEKKDPSTRTS